MSTRDDIALRASNITVSAPSGAVIVDDVSIEARRGRTLVIVGESGAGKSMLSRALCHLLPSGLRAAGTLNLAGVDLSLDTQAHRIRSRRGHGIVWLPQDPFTSLSPTHSCGSQILARKSRKAQDNRDRVLARLAEVGLPPRVAMARPHQLSGGMRQRVAIAAALDTQPEVLIADEPTTALDVTTQRDILELLARIRRERGMALILITHDLSLAREYGDDIVVMRSGRVVESGPVSRVLSQPSHEYTRRLAQVEPRLDGPDPREALVPKELRVATALLKVTGLTKIFRAQRGGVAHVALDGIDFTIAPGEAVGLVGESGSGKTTLARCVVGLERPDSGSVTIDEAPASAAAHRGGWKVPPVSMVFQNPYSALNPSLTVGKALAEALLAVGRSSEEVPQLLTSVGLPVEYASRLPKALSGGERQRVAIARAIATRPQLLVCDEPVSALDVSVQAQVLELLEHLRQELGFALLFITHDLAVARAACDRLMVMKDGVIVEEGPTAVLLESPTHHYTQSLLEAVPGREIKGQCA
ncbi:ABC transporter ATP-binding protein [Schaalia suimastitidis]|uniref:ABC transporter ATP-binding protein n=1 Tax=Schaalia suimastitidis TaxID=121163 RepID=UPI00041EA820|nr:ABC transporter ATP-binding protein [Schaalia suimastitidis]